MKRHISAAVMAVFCLGLVYSCTTLEDKGSSAALNVQAQAPAEAAPVEEKITVLTPLGHPPSIKLKAMAPRLDTLEGKTIYIVDNVYPGSDRLLTEMAAWFEREMPKTKALYKRKSAGMMGGFEGVDQNLWAEIKEKADAVIIGLGH
jgi:hypothetical protein